MKARQKKRAVSGSWRMDETYIKIKGEWWYYYRAVDKSGDIVDFYLSKARDDNGGGVKSRYEVEYLNSIFIVYTRDQ